jgi:hypothetical protein
MKTCEPVNFGGVATAFMLDAGGIVMIEPDNAELLVSVSDGASAHALVRLQRHELVELILSLETELALLETP